MFYYNLLNFENNSFNFIDFNNIESNKEYYKKPKRFCLGSLIATPKEK